MATTYAYMTSGFAAGASNTAAFRQDLGSGDWTRLADPPAPGLTMVSPANGVRQQGGWDGNYWYIIHLDRKLYRYTPSTNTWSTALLSGATVVASLAEDQNWVMDSDGRHLYIYGADGFRRYDPVTNSMENLGDSTTGTFSAQLWMVYDQSDALYLTRGSAGGNIPLWKYQISTGTWTTPGDLPVSFSGAFALWASGGIIVTNGLQGQTAFGAYQYNAGTATWTNRSPAGTNGAGQLQDSPWGLVTDNLVRIWGAGTAASTDYNLNANSGTTSTAPPFSMQQFNSGVVARLYSGTFTWYESDGVTLAAATTDIGSAAVGETLTYHYKVKSSLARAGGVRVAVPTNVATDADDPALVSATSNGTFAKSFDTAALAVNDVFDVYLQVIPTVSQTLGFLKTFALTLAPL